MPQLIGALNPLRAKTWKGVAGGVYTLINTLPLWKHLHEQLMIRMQIAFDTETSGLSFTTKHIIGMSFSWGAANSYYVPVRHETGDKQLKMEDILPDLKAVFDREDLTLTGFNCKFDLHFFANEGLVPKGIVHDVLILHKLLKETESAELKTLAKLEIDPNADMWEIAIDDFRSKKGREKIPSPTAANPNRKVARKKENVHYGMVPINLMTPYAASDTHYTWALWKKKLPLIAENAELRQLYVMESQLLWALLDMEHRGVLISHPYLKQAGPELELEAKRYEESAYKKLGKEINLASNNELVPALRALKIPLSKKTDKGNVSLDVEVMGQLATRYGVCEDILGFRRTKKLKSTYVDNILAKLASDGYLHCTYNQNVSTGRMCVAKGTLVQVLCNQFAPPNGVPIEQIKVNDIVCSFDTNNRLTCRRVHWAGKTGTKHTVKIKWRSNKDQHEGNLCVTPEHEIRFTVGGWIKAYNLKPGHSVLALHSGVTDSYDILSVEPGPTVDVYDLEVEDTHAFIANEICVHNSSKEPNLTNIPAKDKTIRRAFICPDGYVMVFIDFSQIEVRLTSHFSQDPVLLNVYNVTHRDVHTNTMCEVFGHNYDEVTKILEDNDHPEHEELLLLRKVAKVTNFLVIYGGGADNLRAQISTPKRQYTKGQCQTFIDQYFDRLHGVKRWINRVSAQVLVDKYVQNFFGRYRRFPELHDKTLPQWDRGRCQRQAVNFVIQSTAADLFKIVIVRVFDILRGAKSRLVMPIHDEIIFYMHKDELELLSPIVKAMEDWNFRVPITAEVSYATDSWAGKKELHFL